MLPIWIPSIHMAIMFGLLVLFVPLSGVYAARCVHVNDSVWLWFSSFTHLTAFNYVFIFGRFFSFECVCLCVRSIKKSNISSVWISIHIYEYKWPSFFSTQLCSGIALGVFHPILYFENVNHNISNVFSVEINGEHSIFDRLTFNVRMFFGKLLWCETWNIYRYICVCARW